MNDRPELPPLPKPDFNSWFCSLYEGRQAALREDRWMLAQAAFDAAVAAAVERCAAWVDIRRLEFCFQHANHDPHTGAIEFGRGPHAEAKAEYVSELEEIAEGLRATLQPTPTTPKGK